MSMKDYISTVGRFLIADIQKPIFSTEEYSRIRIHKKWVDIANNTGRSFVCRTPTGERIYPPKSLKKHKTVKEVFLRPDEPMVMYELDIPHGEKKPREYFEVS